MDLNALTRLIEDQGRELNAGWKDMRSRLEDVEKRHNRLALFGAASADGSGFDPAESFGRAVKSWYPNRIAELGSTEYRAYRSAFDRYTRSGQNVLSADELKALQVAVDPDGGYLVSAEVARVIERSEASNSIIRAVARALTIGTGELEIPISLTRPATGWVGETQERPTTGGPGLGKLTIQAGEIYAEPEASQRLLDDSAFNVEEFLGEEIGRAFGIAEDQAFISGNGVNKPRGFTTYPTSAVADSAGTRPFGTIQHIPTGQAGAWPTTNDALYDLLVDTVHALRPAYRQGASWVMPTEAVAKVSKLKDDQKNPIWQRSLVAGTPPTLLGYPVFEAENMPAVAANSLSVAFGNWQRAYWIVDRYGVRVLRDPYTNKPFVRFYTTKRVGGGLVDSSALKLIKFAAS